MEKLLEKIALFLEKLKEGISIVNLPSHLFIPKSAESLDIRKLENVSTGTTALRLLTLKAKTGEIINIINYGLYTDIEFASDVEFFIKVNGRKVLRYHGVPDDPNNPTAYRLSIGVSPDLANSALIPCQIQLKPDDELTVDVENTVDDGGNPFELPLGVRLSGYVLTSTDQSSRIVR